MNIKNRKDDIVDIISNLDISPTLYKNAVEKYNSLAEHLQRKGLNVEIYPQGSFALGTVVRPYSQDDTASYDLDFICQVSNTDRDSFSASELREAVKKALCEGERYEEKVEVFDECFTVRYADVNGISFSIDIVPATDESNYNKINLAKKAQNPDLIETSIAIPRCVERKYDWITNNPKGYREWFNRINDNYLAVTRNSYRQQYFEVHKSVFSSVEEIPSELERSSLQRVIQILKHHRDVFYSRHKDGEEHRPISAIINTIVTDIAKHANPASDVYELLTYVVNEFYTYSLQLTMNEALFTQQYADKTAIKKRGNKWVIQNPANPDDNLANSWTDKTAEIFFKWAENLRTDLIESLTLSDSDFRVCIENAFGEHAVESRWGKKYKSLETPTIITSNNTAKPWRM